MQVHARRDPSFVMSLPRRLGVIMVAETMGNNEEGTGGRQKKTRGYPNHIGDVPP
jgi:hypothetical protein